MTKRETKQRRVVDSVARVPAAGVLCLGACVLGGCTTATAPSFRVVSITERERTEQAVVLEFSIEATNRNDEPLPLQRAAYSLTLDGTEVFTGSRIARVTTPRFGSQVLELPAVVPAELVPPGRFDEMGEMRYVLEGEVEYLTPGRLSEFLFDANVRRPKARLDLVGTLELPG